MIQLANDPNAGHLSRNASPHDGKDLDFERRNGRSGHPWPFLSRGATRPIPQGARKAGPRDNGS